MPMLGIIYYSDQHGVMPHNYETAMSIVTLGGSILGQIGFGFGADIWVCHECFIFFEFYISSFIRSKHLKNVLVVLQNIATDRSVATDKNI